MFLIEKEIMQAEIWKDIPGYEGYYQVNNFGVVRSLDKFVREAGGKSRIMRSAILKLFLTKGYFRCGLTINKTQRIYYVHQLVAMAFLNYKPNGRFIVVDHINNIKTDNRLENLQIVSQRHNSSKDRKGTSKYTGVSWFSRDKKWKAQVQIDGKILHLGYFANESEAALAYQNALKELA